MCSPNAAGRRRGGPWHDTQASTDLRAVGDREAKRPDVVRDDAVRHVLAVVVVRADAVLVGQRAADVCDLVEDGACAGNGLLRSGPPTRSALVGCVEWYNVHAAN